MANALTLVLSQVDSTARAYRSVSRTQSDSGTSDAEWWAIVGPVLEQVMDDDELALAGRVGSTVGTEFNAAGGPEHALAFGLDTILDGIQVRSDWG